MKEPNFTPGREYITGHPDRNWEEDYSHENGNYISHCRYCNKPFKGHKRRTVCKQCPNWHEIALMKQPEDNKCAHAGCWAQGEMVGYARCMVKHVLPMHAALNQARAALMLVKDLQFYVDEAETVHTAEDAIKTIDEVLK